MQYLLTQRRYFRESGKTYFPGQTVELPEEVAQEINRNEGPTLKAMQNAQAVPDRIASPDEQIIPDEPAKKRKPRAKK